MGNLKNRIRITTNINISLHEKLAKLSNDTDVPKNKLLDRAIMMLLERYCIELDDEKESGGGNNEC